MKWNLNGKKHKKYDVSDYIFTYFSCINIRLFVPLHPLSERGGVKPNIKRYKVTG